MKQPIRQGIGGNRRESTGQEEKLVGFCKTQKCESTKERGGVVNLQTCGKVRVSPFHEDVVCWNELVQISEQNVREN